MGMSVSRHVAIARVVQCVTVLAGLILMTAPPIAAEQPGAPGGTGQSERDSSGSATICEPSTLGSPYLPVDSWVYPAVLRLYSLGYVDHVYLGMRPWTRASLSHMLEDIDAQIEDANTYGVSTASEAQDIYAALIHFLHYDAEMQCLTHQAESPTHARLCTSRRSRLPDRPPIPSLTHGSRLPRSAITSRKTRLRRE